MNFKHKSTAWASISALAAVALTAAVVGVSIVSTLRAEKRAQGSAFREQPVSAATGAVSSGSYPLALTAGDERLASEFPSTVEKRLWVTGIKKIWMRPPCCGACSVIKQKDFKKLATVLADSSRETPASRELWSQYRLILMTSLKRQDTDLFKTFVSLRKAEMASASNTGARS